MLIMALTITAFILLGMPVSFSMLTGALVYFITSGTSMNILVQQMVVQMSGSFSLLAIPFFMLAGSIMNSGGIARRIFKFCDAMIGYVPGGLAHANVLASVIFAGMSGSAIADTGGLGAIELKAMKDAGYDDEFSCAVTGMSSCIGPIIPPSIGLVLYGMMAEVPVIRLFVAGIIPGLLMAVVMMVIIFFTSKKRRYPVSKKYTGQEKWQTFKEAFWSLMSPVILLVGTMTGVFSATEASVVCCIYSIIVGLAYRELKLSDLPRLLVETLHSTSMVLTLVCCSLVFGAVLTYEYFPQTVATFFTNGISSPILMMIVMTIIILIAGMFMDVTAVSLILTPVFLPICHALGIDLIAWGLISAVASPIGLTTPPVGSILYVLENYTGVPLLKIAKAMIPYQLGFLLLVLIMILCPGIVTFLPNLVLGAA